MRRTIIQFDELQMSEGQAERERSTRHSHF
jgi:hypothetical protein